MSFNVWEKQDSDRKPSCKYEWTSLTGREKKHLLATLPNKLFTLLPADIASTVVQLWRVRTLVHYYILYMCMHTTVVQVWRVRTLVHYYTLYMCMHTTSVQIHCIQDFEALYKLIARWTLTQDEIKPVHTKVLYIILINN